MNGLARARTSLLISVCAASLACGEMRSVSSPMVAVAAAPSPEVASAEEYAKLADNPFYLAADHRLSTFSVDVDTASYSNVRRFILGEGHLPPKEAVRIEEVLNYFHYDYAQPEAGAPLGASLEVSDCPWASGHELVRIGLQAKTIDRADMPPRNLVFLLDVSGSMSPDNRLPMVKKAMAMLVDQLTAKDTVAIVTYAGDSGVALPPTRGDEKGAILAALSRLEPGGSTNGSAGIVLAYELARQHFATGAINRVILSTDGDFNVGVTSQRDLVTMIENARTTGVYLSVLGVGEGNLHDATMEMLADKGNGNYAYLDTLSEARKVLVEQAGGTLVTVANDVKVQAEFDPAEVRSYRLVGYENRVMANKDFADDTKDAGDVGAGHTVTALYEIEPETRAPLAASPPRPTVAASQAKSAPAATAKTEARPLVTVRIRYKDPGQTESKLLTFHADAPHPLESASSDFRFAVAVAEFGLILRESPFKGAASLANVDELAAGVAISDPRDPGGYRGEFRRMVNHVELVLGGHTSSQAAAK
jgi:Ca-activated chloride channel homolog